MRLRPVLSAALLSFAVLGATGRTSNATMSPAEIARRNVVAVRIGPKEISVGELEDRLAAVPRFQLSTMGDTADAIRRKFVLDVIVSEVLLAEGAEKQHLDKDLVVANNLRRALANATMRVAKGTVPPVGTITMDEIRKYYAENKAKFDTPVRYGVWRILCAKREEAVAVIDAAKKSLTTDNFTKLAREHSIDKATSMRGGNLGFVDPEGNSNEAGLKVDPAIPKAAASAKDGQLVPEPVPEGQGFAVVWRKGTVPPAHRTVEEAANQIREAIHKQKMDDASKAEIEAARGEHLSQLNEGVLNSIDISSVDGEIMPRRRPGQVPPLHQIGRAAPRP
jgi:peptidyl-prolyl cis-trans isomerase C